MKRDYDNLLPSYSKEDIVMAVCKRTRRETVSLHDVKQALRNLKLPVQRQWYTATEVEIVVQYFFARIAKKKLAEVRALNATLSNKLKITEEQLQISNQRIQLKSKKLLQKNKELDDAYLNQEVSDLNEAKDKYADYIWDCISEADYNALMGFSDEDSDEDDQDKKDK